MDEDPRVRARLKGDYERAKLEYEQHGDWYETIFENVPISEIELPPPWHSLRYEDNLKRLKETDSMPPVMLYYDDEEKRYKITDGIHRINAAKYASAGASVNQKNIPTLELCA